jgi:molecular chaperone DnaK (HSP70)
VLGEFQVAGIERAVAGSRKIDAGFRIDEDNILRDAHARSEGYTESDSSCVRSKPAKRQ